MQKLQNRADELKLEQIRLRQVIHEKNTASILVGLFQGDQVNNGGGHGSSYGVGAASNGAAGHSDGDGNHDTAAMEEDPRVDALLKRKVEDIPDASKIPELPALILPGQHNNGSKKKSEQQQDATTVPSSHTVHNNNSSNNNDQTTEEEPQEDGIDYQLLGKDRAACSPAELDKIRRERNRMHAKRTRDRKRIFMEEMEVMIRQLEEENGVLMGHLEKMEGETSGIGSASGGAVSSSSLLHSVSPEFGPATCPLAAPASAPLAQDSLYSYNAEPSSIDPTSGTHAELSYSSTTSHPPSQPPPQAATASGTTTTTDSSSSRGDFLHQIESLLAAAGAFEKQPGRDNINAISCAESDVTASTNNSEHNSLSGEDLELLDREEEEEHCCKKRRLLEEETEVEMTSSTVPSSITTTKLL